MSSVFQPKRKELANVKVVSSEAYSANKRKYKLVGTVRRGYTAFVATERNKRTGKSKFIEDTSALTKKAKQQLVTFFSDSKNDKKRVAYLVVAKSKLNKRGGEKNA